MMPPYNQQNFQNPMNGTYNSTQNPFMSMSGGAQSVIRWPEQNSSPAGPPKKPTIPAMIISTEDDIIAEDVPMNGSVSLFLTNDCSHVYAKRWNNKGTIDTIHYIQEESPIADQATEMDVNATLTAMMDRLANIEKLVKRNVRPNAYKQNYNKNRTTQNLQEVETHE